MIVGELARQATSVHGRRWASCGIARAFQQRGIPSAYPRAAVGRLRTFVDVPDRHVLTSADRSLTIHPRHKADRRVAGRLRCAHGRSGRWPFAVPVRCLAPAHVAMLILLNRLARAVLRRCLEAGRRERNLTRQSWSERPGAAHPVDGASRGRGRHAAVVSAGSRGRGAGSVAQGGRLAGPRATARAARSR